MNKCGDWKVDVFIRNASGDWDKQYTDAIQIIESPVLLPACSVTVSPSNPLPGQTLYLNVSASDNTYLKEVIVFWNDGALHSNAWNSVIASSLSQTQPIGSYSDGQRLECWVVALDTSGGTTESKRETIVVSMPAEPPVIVMQPVDQAVVAGDEVILSVNATGTEPLSYHWLRNSLELHDDGRVTGTTSSRLSISTVTTNDAGSYSVIVQNGVGTAVSASATLTVASLTTNRYLFIPGFFSWEQASTDAGTRGGHLATVTSRAEWNAMQDARSRLGVAEAWIGGTDAETEGAWRWVTGEPFSFSTWDFGEPNNSGDEDHLSMRGHDGSMNDLVSSAAMGYFLELESGQLGRFTAITVDEVGVLLTWEGPGVLQSADSIGGPWIDVTTATNPLLVDPAEQQRFYRLRSF